MYYERSDQNYFLENVEFGAYKFIVPPHPKCAPLPGSASALSRLTVKWYSITMHEGFYWHNVKIH